MYYKCINIEFLDMLKREMMYHDLALFEDLGDSSIPSTDDIPHGWPRIYVTGGKTGLLSSF